MSNTNNVAAQNAPAMSAKEFKVQTFTAYVAYVALIEGKATIAETLPKLQPIMAAHGFALTAENIVNVLTVRMTAYGKDKGEVARKVKSIGIFRAFVKGGWKEVNAAPVHSAAGVDPSAKKAQKAKRRTKAEIAARNADLVLQNADLMAKVNAMAAALAANGIAVPAVK